MRGSFESGRVPMLNSSPGIILFIRVQSDSPGIISIHIYSYPFIGIQLDSPGIVSLVGFLAAALVNLFYP